MYVSCFGGKGLKSIYYIYLQNGSLPGSEVEEIKGKDVAYKVRNKSTLHL